MCLVFFQRNLQIPLHSIHQTLWFQNHHIGGILQCPEARSVEIGCNTGSYSLFRFVIEADTASEPINQFTRHFRRGFHGHNSTFPREHIDMLSHVLGQVQAMFHTLHFALWFCRCVRHGDIADMVNTVMGDVVVLVHIANQVILPIGGNHLIRVDQILLRLSAVIRSQMELLVRTVVAVVENHLPILLNGFIQNLNGVEQFCILRLIFRQIADMTDFGLEVPIGQPLDLLNQILALAVGDVLGEQEAINEQPQFRI